MLAKISGKESPLNGTSKKIKQKNVTPRPHISAAFPEYPFFTSLTEQASGGIK